MNALDQAIWDTRVKEAVESRKEGAVSNKNLAIIAADNAIKRLTDENAALIESADRLMNMRIELEKERNAMREEIAELRDGNEYVLVRELREQLRWRHWPEAPTKNGEYLFDHEEIPEKEVVSWIDGEWSVHNTYKTNHRWLPIPQDKGRDL